SKSFYLTLVPLIALLALAVYQRISHYGFTEERYILMVLALWLTVNTIYSLGFLKDDIRFIPASLTLLALTSTFGPHSASDISRHSQQRRLAQLLDAPVEGTDERENIITYLLEAHGLQSMQAFTETDLDRLEREIAPTNPVLPPDQMKWLKRGRIFGLLALPPGAVADGQSLAIQRSREGVIPIQGYDYAYRVEPDGADAAQITLGANDLRVCI